MGNLWTISLGLLDDWKSKFLSFAGRVQLITSVLAAINSYWAASFMLPIRLIQHIERRLRGFLWCQGVFMAGKAKVSWNQVCLPKSEGGLGIRRLVDTNYAFLVGHIHSIINLRQSLWVKWVHMYKLKGRSFWDVPLLPNSSWCWRKMLQLRPVVRQFFWSKIGNGRNTSLWFDKWHTACPLADFISPRMKLQAGFHVRSMVAEGIANGRWLWPSAWQDLFPVLNTLNPPVLEPHRHDIIRWKDGDTMQPFSTSLVWNSIRHSAQEVDWYKLIWFSQAIPRHSFFLWLVFKQKLVTQDRIKRWQIQREGCMNLMCCLLCFQDEETHQHLFFECPYVKKVWNALLTKAGFGVVHASWPSVVAWLRVRGNSKSLRAILGRLLVATAVYTIWQERNIRFFQNLLRPPEAIVDVIMDVISLKLKSMRFKNSATVTNMLKPRGIDKV